MSKIKYGGAWIKEHKGWKAKYPTGPVHWDVWVGTQQIGTAIPANELSQFLVTRNLLILW